MIYESCKEETNTDKTDVDVSEAKAINDEVEVGETEEVSS